MAPADSYNPAPIEVTNIDELARVIKESTHSCTSQEILTDIRIGVAETNRDIISMTACFQQLNARFEEHMREQDQVLREHMQIIAAHSNDLVDVKHNCRFPDQWDNMDRRINALEHAETLRKGSSKWEDRLFSIMSSIAVAVVIFVILFILKGGKMF